MLLLGWRSIRGGTAHRAGVWAGRCRRWPVPLLRRRVSRGAVLVAALVTLAVVGMIGAGLVLSVAANQRQLRGQQQRLQALWLAESAASRAAAQLAVAADYEGETWQAPVELADGGTTGVAVIRVQPVPERPLVRQITVEAYFPDDPVHRARHEKQLQLPSPEE